VPIESIMPALLLVVLAALWAWRLAGHARRGGCDWTRSFDGLREHLGTVSSKRCTKKTSSGSSRTSATGVRSTATAC
jgi:hypothetical protein